jgi:actin-related protein
MSGMDESIRADISRTILVTGSSSQLEGLADRLQSALSVPMMALGIENFIVVTGCSPGHPLPVNEVMWQGCSKIVSAALEQGTAFPNHISAINFERNGSESFDSIA